MTTNQNKQQQKNGLIQDLWIRLAQPYWDGPFIFSLLILECILSLFIVRRVPYTEIDWTTYLQQVQLVWVDGIYDYIELKGDTGPLVYPAGFLYLYGALWKITNGSVHVGQYIFVGLYLATQAVVLNIYTMILRDQRSYSFSSSSSSSFSSSLSVSPKTIWCWRIMVMFISLCGSKRIHSIFLLRLFNDGPTMLLLYVSIFLFMKQSWRWGCVVFSLAVSIKMNVLLFAPGLLLLLLAQGNLLECVLRLSICAVVQLILGLPFLLHNPISYLRKAFELDRVFQYKWTVNWKFLPEDIFVSKPLSLVLLLAHISTLIYLFCFCWIPPKSKTTAATTTSVPIPNHKEQRLVLSPTFICYTLLVSNWIGIVFARTLHYQFYVWYFHALPLLLWVNMLTTTIARNTTTSSASSTVAVLDRAALRMGLWLVVEYAFNVFPATFLSSLLLQVAHGIILVEYIRPPHVLNIPMYSSIPNNNIVVKHEKKQE